MFLIKKQQECLVTRKCVYIWYAGFLMRKDIEVKSQSVPVSSHLDVCVCSLSHGEH